MRPLHSEVAGHFPLPLLSELRKLQTAEICPHPRKCTRTQETPICSARDPTISSTTGGPHMPPHNANPNAQRDAGRGRRGRYSPFCSLSLESCNLLLRLDSARVPVLWPARADVSRRRPRRSIWLTGARAHSRRALGKRRLQGSAQPGKGCAAVEAPGRLWQQRIAG
jgi:hypothetical protein